MTAVLARRRALIPLAAVLLVAAAVPPLLWLTGWADHRDRTYATRSEEGGRKLIRVSDDGSGISSRW